MKTDHFVDKKTQASMYPTQNIKICNSVREVRTEVPEPPFMIQVPWF